MKLHKVEPLPDRVSPEERAYQAELVPVAPGSAEKAPRFALMRCSYCGGIHAQSCPRVARLEYDGSGRVTAVEFWAWGTWPEDRVVYADDIWPAES